MKKFLAIILALLMMFTLFACSQVENGESSQETETNVEEAQWPREITDVLGNTLTLEEPATSVVGTHNPTLNLAVIMGGGGKYIKGFGNKQMADELYSIVFPELANDVVQIGKGKSVNYETVLEIAPDIAILPERFASLVDEFNAVGINALVVLSSEESFESIMNSLTLMGSILGEDARAADIVSMMQGIIDNAETATANVADADKPSVLFLGSSSILSVATDSLIQTEIIAAAGAKNAVSGINVYGDFAEVSAEEIINWNPEIILIPEYAKYTIEDVLNEEAFSSLTAVQNGAVYQFPSALEPWDYPTASCVLGLSWATSLFHPDLYSADDMMSDVDSFYNLVYGQTFTAEQLGIQ